jgi:hypothetical protein
MPPLMFLKSRHTQKTRLHVVQAYATALIGLVIAIAGVVGTATSL